MKATRPARLWLQQARSSDSEGRREDRQRFISCYDRSKAQTRRGLCLFAWCARHAIIDVMATYAISDIHGAYDEFQRLLDKIRFQYDGSDSLYLLGDYGDWG